MGMTPEARNARRDTQDMKARRETDLRKPHSWTIGRFHVDLVYCQRRDQSWSQPWNVSVDFDPEVGTQSEVYYESFRTEAEARAVLHFHARKAIENTREVRQTRQSLTGHR